MKKFSVIAALAWTLFIICVLLLPASDLPEFSFSRIKGFDKLIHFTIFAVAGFLWAKALNDTDYKKNILILSLLLGLVISLMTEWMQSLDLIGRSFELLDLISNIIGVIFGLTIYFLSRKFIINN
jgi:VanZ family protein